METHKPLPLLFIFYHFLKNIKLIFSVQHDFHVKSRFSFLIILFFTLVFTMNTQRMVAQERPHKMWVVSPSIVKYANHLHIYFQKEREIAISGTFKKNPLLFLKYDYLKVCVTNLYIPFIQANQDVCIDKENQIYIFRNHCYNLWLYLFFLIFI